MQWILLRLFLLFVVESNSGILYGETGVKQSVVIAPGNSVVFFSCSFTNELDNKVTAKRKGEGGIEIY